MLNINSRSILYAQRIERAVNAAVRRNLGYAGGLTAKTARRSIRYGIAPAPPGHPPHTSTGLLRRAIVYDVDVGRRMVLIGPSGAVVGDVGAAHEYGGEFRGRHYPVRPFMAPALTKVRDRIVQIWANSIV